MPFLAIHSIRTKIIVAIFAVVAVMGMLGLHVLRVHVQSLRAHDLQMSGIISEYRLSVATDQLIAVYSSCIQNPQNADYRSQFAANAAKAAQVQSRVKQIEKIDRVDEGAGDLDRSKKEDEPDDGGRDSGVYEPFHVELSLPGEHRNPGREEEDIEDEVEYRDVKERVGAK